MPTRSPRGDPEVRPSRPLRYAAPVTRILAVFALLFVAFAAGAADVEEGSKAPGFSLAGSDGRTHTLDEHAGKRGVVLAWFPKAFTPG